ncbi:MAG: tyrosine-protein phosphatase [Dehalococcoidia bacterium]|nr:tyrosine-protein phosphatase [Dehalococcoidia bacterium]
MTMTFERRILLKGASNFRDLGGYATTEGKTVTWRRIFRADALTDLAPEDVAAILDLNIGDVFDLRTAKELEFLGTNPLVEHGVRHHHVPFVPEIGLDRDGAAVPAARPAPDDHAAHATGYLEMLERGKGTVGRVLTHLAEAPEQGAVFHCTGGRDRTGMTAALILSVLGVPRATIEADYALTTEYLEFNEDRRNRMQELFGPITVPAGRLVTYAEVMRLTLAGLDERYGSPEAYLEDAGVTRDHQDALRRTYLDE